MCSLKLFPSSPRALAALAATCRGRGAHARACRGPGNAERGAAQVPPLRRRRGDAGPLKGAPRVWGRLRFPVSGRIWGLSRHPVRRGRTRRPLPPAVALRQASLRLLGRERRTAGSEESRRRSGARWWVWDGPRKTRLFRGGHCRGRSVLPAPLGSLSGWAVALQPWRWGGME